MSEIKDRLKILREKAGLNQADIAYKTGVHVNTVLNYEKGHRVPDANFLQKFIELTNCDPGWLLTGKEPERVLLRDEERMLLKAFRKAKPNDQEGIRLILKKYAEPE